MAKFANDLVMDAALDYIANNGDRYDICAGQPTTYAEATSTNSLGTTTLTTGYTASDYTKANGDTSGRKVTVAAQSGISITASGTADHVAITNGTDTLIYVTTLSASQAVTSGNTANVAAFDIEIADPV